MSAEGGRVVIVTGASRGIGRAIAVELSRAGESVVAVARTAADLEETRRFMEEVRPAGSGARHAVFTADVTREDEVEALFRAVAERYRRVDVLVNNAGHVDPVGILEMTLENWSRTLATNLTAAFLCTREFVRANKRVGGKIINIASTAGLTPRPGWSAYAAAKA
ncbi:MAG: SDR family NAD(P)-dependent oxidoreductase, partial [Clostridia bacterium]|nr:SDR family NAD(P)-dependent oxidoreductase [Clostridia bacterium]